MKASELNKLGIPRGELTKLAQRLLSQAAAGGVKKRKMKPALLAVLENPEEHVEDGWLGELARALVDLRSRPSEERREPVPWKQWGDDLEPQAVAQMVNACRLPVAVRGALMPDAHLGYGLPIGGVLATEKAVIPYAVGVDIACRMKLTVFDMPPESLERNRQELIRALEEQTRFGVGSSYQKPRNHAVMDRDWSVSPITVKQKSKAWKQLGTSGSGNHFVEFGKLKVTERTPELKLAPGEYLALLSHSGSRGAGAQVAAHYSRLAMDLHPRLPKELRHLAWLSLDSEEGQEYWNAMQLMGHYASANHAVIHRQVIRALKAGVLTQVENHHNFAWKEEHDGREVIVHRKGATPAGKGAIGIIPGSMSAPAFVVRGRGNPESLNSASHGAGRVMSRKKAKQTFRWKEVNKHLQERGVTLLSAGIDEVPMVYKNIHAVMEQQQDLVEILARFDPKLVKMAPAGERPED